MCVAGGVAPGLWVSHTSGGSEIEIILENRQSTVLHFVMWLDIVGSVIKKEKVAAVAQELFEVFSCNPFTGCAAGWLLDMVVGDIFARGGVWNIHETEKSPWPGPKNCHSKIWVSSIYADKYLIIGHAKHPPVFISNYPPEDPVIQHIETIYILNSTSTNSVALPLVTTSLPLRRKPPLIHSTMTPESSKPQYHLVLNSPT